MKKKLLLFLVAVGLMCWVSPAQVLSSEPIQQKKITLEEAIKQTITNNIDLKILKKQIDARELDKDKADFFSDKLINADEKVNDAWKEFNQKKTQFEAIKMGINNGSIKEGSPYYLTPEQIEKKKRK
ncbi:MAG: hypothetical protein ACOX4L_10615 [Bacillota bacterium]|jgi:hypothetical protein